MKYSLRAVKGVELSRIHFNADTDREARGMCRDVYERRAPVTDVWVYGKVVVVDEAGIIIHTFARCDYCNEFVCDDDCGSHDSN